MEFELLLAGLREAMEPNRLMWGFVGVTLGTIVGALPGIGPVTGIALLLPLMFGMEPVS
ncbi:MAG: tripartite tricarboxylate transporter permease, partial [Syntrophomonadaceae bacterium]|nr:tripartite tricarboxylate transporter permease [Syntrophomonadaceae bacterium]